MKNFTCFLAVPILVALTGCNGNPKTAAAAAPVDCGAPIAGLDAVLRASQFVVFGELHGTVEIPAFFSRAVCRAALAGTPVRVALEIATSEQGRIDAFMNTAMNSAMNSDTNSDTNSKSPDIAAISSLTTGAFWTDPYQDGRRSRAMLETIDRLRELKQAGLRVDIVAFDPALPGSGRDAYLAESLTAIRKANPDARYMVLTGNYHARRDVGAPWDTKLEFMAHRLAASEPTLLTLNVNYSGGAAWICSGNEPESCGAQEFGGRPGGAAGITLKPDPDYPDSYHGTFFVGTLSASPPAVGPARP